MKLYLFIILNLKNEEQWSTETKSEEKEKIIVKNNATETVLNS